MVIPTMRDRAALKTLLSDLANAMEDLVLSGTTGASKASEEKLSVAFSEASRNGLLRLGSTLRIVLEELRRFSSDPPEQAGRDFAPDRLSFFVGRAWILARAMANALEKGDEAAFDQLEQKSETRPVDGLRVVTLGVIRRVVPGAFAAFEMRLRPADDATAQCLPPGPLVWSCVFPMKAELKVPVEAFLTLQQKQGFKPNAFLMKKVIEISQCQISLGSPTRVLLGPQSTVTTTDDFDEWGRFSHWDRAAFIERLETHTPSPLELPIELSAEAVLMDWTMGPLEDPGQAHPRPYRVASLTADQVPYRMRIDLDAEDLAKHVVKAASSSARPALFGLVNVEFGHAIFTPMSLMRSSGPDYCSINTKKIDKAALVRALHSR